MAISRNQQLQHFGIGAWGLRAWLDARLRLAVALLLAVGGLFTFLAWSAPYRAARAFVRAVERRDARAIVALSYPAEADTGLTPRAVRLALDRIFSTPVREDGDLVPTAGPPWDSWRGHAQSTSLYEGTICRWHVNWADARTGKPIPAQGPEGRLVSDVFVKPSDSGWRVLVGQFLHDTCLSRWGVSPAGGQAFTDIAAQAGITGRVETSGRLRPVVSSRAPS